MKSFMETGNTYPRLQNCLFLVHIHNHFSCSFFGSLNFTSSLLQLAWTFPCSSAHNAGRKNVGIRRNCLKPQGSSNSDLSSFQDVLKWARVTWIYNGNTDTTLHNALYHIILKPHTLKTFSLVHFLTWLLPWESWSRQPVWWEKNFHLTSREITFFFYREIPVQKALWESYWSL